MTRFEQLIVELIELVPLSAGDPELGGASIAVTDLEVTMPIEARVDTGGFLKSSLPRGRMKTGFDAQLSRITARFESRSA